MTRTSALDLEIHKVDSIAVRLRKNPDLTTIECGPESIRTINPSFAFWKRLVVHNSADRIRYAELFPHEAYKYRYEAFVYDKDGNLVRATYKNDGIDQRYYFLADRLFRAFDKNGDTLNLRSVAAKSKAIGLLMEGNKIRRMTTK